MAVVKVDFLKREILAGGYSAEYINRQLADAAFRSRYEQAVAELEGPAALELAIEA